MKRIIVKYEGYETDEGNTLSGTRIDWELEEFIEQMSEWFKEWIRRALARNLNKQLILVIDVEEASG